MVIMEPGAATPRTPLERGLRRCRPRSGCMSNALAYYSPDQRWWLKGQAVLSPEQRELNDGAYRIYLARQYAKQRDALTTPVEWPVPLATIVTRGEAETQPN
jgi:hypothetical protein